MKRRRLTPEQEVLIIYDVSIGFVERQARFKQYKRIMYNGVYHEIPAFEYNNQEITGLECFWILPSDIDDDLRIEQLQRELIDLQLQVSQYGYSEGFDVPEKIKDKEIRDMAVKNAEYQAKLIQELGYNPLDYSWVEKELATTSLERSWFKFQREHKGSFGSDWDQTVKTFQEKYHTIIAIEEAYDLTRKWKRFVIGAWNTIASQNTNIEDWKSAARKFEKHHYDIEVRMAEWTEQHRDNYPMAKVVQNVQFRHGPYFNECVERVPQLFTDATCSFIKPEVILQVISYDPKLKYIRLDFTDDIRKLIKPNTKLNDPTRPMKADYIIYVTPSEVEDHLEFLGSLD